MKKFFSIDSVAQKSVLLARRFPISVLLTAILAWRLLRIVSAGTGEFFDNIIEDSYRLYVFLSIGVVISLTAALWLEDRFGLIRQYIVTAAVTLLWGIYCFFLPAHENFGTFSSEFVINKILEVSAIGVIAALAMFFIAFLKKDRDGAFWNFTARTLFQFILSQCFGGVLNIGLACAVFAVDALLNFDMGARVYGYLAILCAFLFSPLYFMANIPNKTEKRDETVAPNKTLKFFGLYILAPLAAVYAVILYIYLFKIIFTWELPRGLVSWLVSALACCGMLIVTCLYPYRKNEKNRLVEILSRWFGVIILPLLILMSVGIFRRIGDYGITILRFYLLLVNVWFYAVYAHIFITRGLRVKGILISFAALVLLSSIGPWNVPRVTKRILTAEVSRYLGNQKITLADNERTNDIIDRMKPDDRKNAASKIKYLHDIYGEASVRVFFGDGDSSGRHAREFIVKIAEYSERTEPEVMLAERPVNKNSGRDPDLKSSHYFKSHVNKTPKMSGFNTFIRFSYQLLDGLNSSREGDVHYGLNDSQLLTIEVTPHNRSFTVDLPEIVKLGMRDSVKRADEFIINGDDFAILVTKIHGTHRKDGDGILLLPTYMFEGYLFYDRQ